MSVLSIVAGKHILELKRERAEWSARLRLAFECDWDDRARRIIETELRRLDAEIERARGR